MSIKRCSDWETRFRTAIEEADRVPFAWGQADCATAMADVVLAITGVDPLSGVRGRYHSEKAALRLMLTYRWPNWTGAVAGQFAVFGWPEIDPRAARVGDVGYTRADAFCVRLPHGFAARANSFGWQYVPDVDIAWAVG